MTDPNAPTANAVTLTERVAAPPETIFSFLIEPEKIFRWMGRSVNIDPQPGVTFWVDVTGSDIASGIYLEVDPPHRVVFTWGWEGSPDVPPGSSAVTITLSPDGDHTTVILRHDGLPGGATNHNADLKRRAYGLVRSSTSHPCPHFWQSFGFEPWVLGVPMAVSRRRVGRDNPIRQILGPTGDSGCERLGPIRDVACLSIGADDHFESVDAKLFEQALMNATASAGQSRLSRTR